MSKTLGLGIFLLAIGIAAFIVFQPGPEKKYKTVGVISHAPVADPAFDGAKDYLSKEGYIENETIFYHYGGATGSIEALAAEADRLIKLSPDVLLALSTPAALAAQKAAKPHGIPVVFAPNSDPVGANVVDSLKKPGRNTTGVTFGKQEDKRLEWLTRLVPSARKICFPHNPKDSSPTVALAKLKKVESDLNIELVEWEIMSKEDLIAQIPTLCEGTDAIFLPTDALVSSEVATISRYATKRGMATSVPHRKGVKDGAFTSYGFGIFELGQQAGRLVEKIFNGVDAGSLPVETAEFKLMVNLKVAEELKIDLSDSILRQAIVVK